MEEFLVVLVLLAVVLLVFSPIVSLFLLFGVRRRIDEIIFRVHDLENSLAGLKHKIEASAKSAREPVKQEEIETSSVAVMHDNETVSESEIESDMEKPLAGAGHFPPPVPDSVNIRTAAVSAQQVHRPVEAHVTPEREQRVPHPFEAKALQALRSIWSWIIVGEEHRRPGVSFEFAVASNWLLRVGVVVMVFGVYFFLRYAAERGMLNPQARVALTLLAGAGMIAAGIRLLGRKYHLLAQGLLGAGLATLYAAIFAAANIFNLIGVGTSFMLMAAITVGAGYMSVRFNSILMALLGIIGGYGTPVMLSTGSADFFGLFSYLLLLGCGVLGIAHYKNWRLLNFLAFWATAILAVAAVDNYYQPKDFATVMPFLTAFFILFSTTVFIHQMHKRQASTVLELLMLLLNATGFFGLGYHLMEDSGMRESAAILSLALAAFYMLHVYVFLRRQFHDRGLVLSFIALASFFVAMTMPILLSREWLTVSWSLQALLMLWIAGKMKSRFLRQVAFLLYMIVLWRFFWLDLRVQFSSSLTAGISLSTYIAALLERLLYFGVPIASLAGALRLINSPVKPGELRLSEENDTQSTIDPRLPAAGVFAAVSLMLFLYLHLELNRSLLFLYSPLRFPALTMLWLSACLVIMAVRDKAPAAFWRFLLGAFFACVLLKLLLFDLPAWGISWELMRYKTDYSFLA